MKSARTVCATITVLIALTAGVPALAAITGFVIGTAKGTTEEDCTKAGGTVTVDADGHKICVPRPAKTAAPAPAGREPPN